MKVKKLIKGDNFMKIKRVLELIVIILLIVNIGLFGMALASDNGDKINLIAVANNDNNYVAHDDIKKYMDASNTKDYDTAVSNVINSNDDESLHNNGLKIVMTKSEFDECTEEEKANLESANVELEIYK